MRYILINPDDIPDDLPPGKYNTKIVKATWNEIHLQFIGTRYDKENSSCLLPLEYNIVKGTD